MERGKLIVNTSGEAADQAVRMSLEVGEAALKISGEGAKQLAVLLYAVLQDQSKSMAKSKGKTRLETLVRTGKPLKVFSVKESDLKIFAKEAKAGTEELFVHPCTNSQKHNNQKVEAIHIISG